MATCDEDDEQDTAQLDSNFGFEISGIALTGVTVLGCVLNAFNLVIFKYHKHGYCGLRPYLIALSTWDILTLTSGWCALSLPNLIQLIPANLFTRSSIRAYVSYIFLVFYPISLVSMTGSVASNVVVLLERYLALCHTLFHRRASCKKRAKCVITVVCVFSLLLNVPRCLEYRLEACYTMDGNITSRKVVNGFLAFDATYIAAFMAPTSIALLTVGPLITQFVMLMRILVTLQQSALRRSSLSEETNVSARHASFTSKGRNEALSLTRMLVAIVIKFLICYTLPAALDIMHVLIIENVFADVDMFGKLANLSNLLVFTHSASNFLIYWACNMRFRRHMRQLLCEKGQIRLSKQIKSSLLAHRKR